MSEQQWLKANDFSTLHRILWNVTRDRPRKYRLIGCNFCRLICSHITDECFHAVVDLAEQYADDPQRGPQLLNAFRRAEESGVLGRGAGSELYVTLEACAPYSASDEFGSNEIARALGDAYDMLRGQAHPTAPQPVDQNAAFHQADEIVVRLIREIFGNPFRSVAFDPAWRTSDVWLLAEGTYEKRAFDRMPILADALQDAGCDSDDILGHLRDTKQMHVRGCWALDLVLGKE